MNDPYLILTPVLMLGVLALARFVGCQLVFPHEGPPDPTAFVTATVLGGLRNDFTGWVGMAIEVGPAPVQVLELGRTMLTGSTQPHIVKIVRALPDGGGEDLGFVTILPSAAQMDFAYVDLATPVTLTPSTQYYVVSHEELGGDSFHHSDTTVATTSVAVVTSAVFNPDATPRYFLDATVGHTYGPLDFKYRQSS